MAERRFDIRLGSLLGAWPHAVYPGQVQASLLCVGTGGWAGPDDDYAVHGGYLDRGSATSASRINSGLYSTLSSQQITL